MRGADSQEEPIVNMQQLANMVTYTYTARHCTLRMTLGEKLIVHQITVQSTSNDNAHSLGHIVQHIVR